jgi:hypothetical protein
MKIIKVTENEKEIEMLKSAVDGSLIGIQIANKDTVEICSKGKIVYKLDSRIVKEIIDDERRRAVNT